MGLLLRVEPCQPAPVFGDGTDSGEIRSNHDLQRSTPHLENHVPQDVESAADREDLPL